MSQPALLVDCLKIINWLQDRNKINKDWYPLQKACSQKLKMLLQNPQQQYGDCGVPELLVYLKQNSQNFHYCDVVKVCQMLISSKLGENKSMVFGYSDARVKNWVNLRKFMQGKQLHIVNTARFLAQGLCFDLPGLDKGIEMFGVQVENLKRKIDFNENVKYQQMKQVGIQRGKLGLGNEGNIVSQIPGVVRQVVRLFGVVEEEIKKLNKFYEVYLRECQNGGVGELAKLGELQKFIFEGNVVLNSSSGSNNVEQKYASFMNWQPQPANEWGIEIQSLQKSVGQDLSRNERNETTLQNRNSRLLLIQELNQILYFYMGLRYQNQKPNNNNNSNRGSIIIELGNNISLVQSQIQECVRIIQNLLELINGEIATRIEIKTNSKAYQILLAKFRHYEQNIEQIQQQNREYKVQIQEIQVKREAMIVELRKLRRRLVESKGLCQGYMSQFVKREIRITGEINKLQ